MPQAKTVVDSAVEAWGLDPSVAATVGVALSAVALGVPDAALFGHGLGAHFPLSLTFTKTIICLIVFAVSLPFNRGPPAGLSLKMFQHALVPALFYALQAYSSAHVFAAYGTVSLCAARSFACVLAVILEGAIFKEGVARLVVCSTFVLVLGGIVAAGAERAHSAEGSPMSAAMHAASFAAFFVTARGAFPADAPAKQCAMHIGLLAGLGLGLGAAMREAAGLLAQPSSEAGHVYTPLFFSGVATAYALVAQLWCVRETSASTACLVTTYASLPTIPLAAVAVQGAHAASLAAAAEENPGKPLLPALAPRGFGASMGVGLMMMACMCFAYSKERQRRLEALLRHADEVDETTGLVATHERSGIMGQEDVEVDD